MSVFWVIFWLAFIGLPLLIWIASFIAGKDSGFQKATSHYWAFQRSGAKVRDATRRDVWKHQNPGKSWEDRNNGCIIFMVIVFIALLAWGAEILSLIIETPTPAWYLRIIAPILGGISAGVFLGIQSFMSNYRSNAFLVLHIIALVLMAVGVIGALILTFLDLSLPLSQHSVWAPAAATGILLIADKVLGGTNNKQAGKAGNQLSEWVEQVIKLTGGWTIEKVDGRMMLAVYELQNGNYDWKIDDPAFFKLTESLMLDLVSGRQMSIKDDEIYRARNEVIKALQAFYFYCLEKVPTFSMHSRIKKALKK
jgi:hypothetical protein